MMDMRPTMPPVPQISPRLVITEQPKQRGMRFRYLCEGRSAGSIPGEKTTAERKTWPTVQIQNYQGEVTIRVSLVSTDKIPRPHPHSLVGKDCADGICTVRVTPETQMTATFSNLGVQCVKRKEVAEALKTRQRLQVDPFNSAQNNNQQTTDIDLNVVLLCFEAFINQGNYHYVIQPVLANPIYDKKATGSALLRICRVDRSCGSCKGGDEVYLLCDKVQKDDITICFFDVNSGWEAYGEFSPTDVHRQVAIVFRTPAYKDQNISQATKVLFQLRRGSDHETSDSKEFTYLPSHHVQPHISRMGKRSRMPDQYAKNQLREHIKSSKVARPDNPGMQYNAFPPSSYFASHSPFPMDLPQYSPANYSRIGQGMSRPPVSQLYGPSSVSSSLGPSSPMQQSISSPMQQSMASPMPVSQFVKYRTPEVQQGILSPQQQPLGQMQRDYASPASQLDMSPYQPSVTAQNTAEDHEKNDSIASFSLIDTDGINSSIKNMSLEPIEPSPDISGIKTEQQDPGYQYPNHQSPASSVGVVHPFSGNYDIAVSSPEYQVGSPHIPYQQQLANAAAPLQQPPPPPLMYSQLQSLNVDASEDKLPSYDLTQTLDSAPFEDSFI